MACRLRATGCVAYAPDCAGPDRLCLCGVCQAPVWCLCGVCQVHVWCFSGACVRLCCAWVVCAWAVHDQTICVCV